MLGQGKTRPAFPQTLPGGHSGRWGFLSRTTSTIQSQSLASEDRATDGNANPPVGKTNIAAAKSVKKLVAMHATKK